MPTPPTLDEIDLGDEKRRIEFPPFLSIWVYFGMAAFWLLLIVAGLGMIPFRAAEHAVTLIIILILAAFFILLADVGLAGVGWYFSGQKLIVFADGVCHERRGQQECYRWKDVKKVVYYTRTPGVYWLHFKNGRKVSVSVLDGITEKEWSAVRRLLERKIPDKFVDEG